MAAGQQEDPISRYELVMVHMPSTGENFFPKGRKDVGERLEDTAIRETYEETGLSCHLLPLPVPTRATQGNVAGDGETNVVEPVACSLRSAGDVQKIIYWFVAVVDDDQPAMSGTQMPDEDFQTLIVPLGQSGDWLQWEEDKEVLGLVVGLLRRLHE